MPTKDELRREAEATGVSFNTLLAQHYSAGTLDVGSTPREQAIAAARQQAPVLGRSGLFGEVVTEAEVVQPTFRTPAEQQAQAAQRMAPQKGAFEPLPGEAEQVLGPQPGLQPPRTRIPGLAKLDKALANVQETYKGAEAGLTEAFQKERGAIGEWEKTEKEKARAETGVLLTRQQEVEHLQAENIGREEKRQVYINTEMGKLRDSIDLMKSSKIDPYRFYRHPDGSTDFPKSIAAVIAVGLGALGSSLPASMGGTGGPNMAMAILDRAIDRDLAAQRDDIANQRAGVGLQMNLLSQMRGQFSDERQAERGAWVIMLETFKMKAEATAAKSGTKEVAARAANLIASIDQKEAGIIGNMQISAAKEHALGEEKMFGARSRQAGLQIAQHAAQQKAMTTKGGKQLPASAVTKMADFRAASGILGKVKETWNKEMTGSTLSGVTQYAPWSTESKKYNDKVRAAAQFVGKKLEGRMTDEDYDRILAMFPAAGDSNDRAQAKFAALEDYLGAMESSTVETYGQTGFDVSGFSKSQVKPVEGFVTK